MPAVLRRLRGLDRPAQVAGVLLLLFITLSIAGPWLPFGDPEDIGAGPRLDPPSWEFPLGTDELGRSFLPRAIEGIRTTFFLSTLAVLLTAAASTVLGMIAAYRAGLLDVAIMRAADLLFSFPAIILGLLISAVLGPGMGPAKVAGASMGRVLFVHVLPNIAGAILVQLTYAISVGMLIESGISFLGLGSQSPHSSLGSLLRLGTAYLTVAPWLALSSGILLSIIITSINLLGDGLRDMLEPIDAKLLT
jgi:peptide/nickel transport system permease protein